MLAACGALRGAGMRFDLHDYRPGVLVLDMQRLFTRADGPFGNPAGAALCAAVNGLLAACSPFGLPVLVSRYVLADDAGDAGLLAGDPVVSGGFFGASSPWAQNDPALRLPAASVHLQRNRPGAFHGGELEAAMRSARPHGRPSPAISRRSSCGRPQALRPARRTPPCTSTCWIPGRRRS